LILADRVRIPQTPVSHTTVCATAPHVRREPSNAVSLAVSEFNASSPRPEMSSEKLEHMTGTLIGYARVSTADQNLDLQSDALSVAGCTRVFMDTASGSIADRPQLTACLDYVRAGDTLVAWRLDRLGRSLPHLIDTVRGLADRGVGFRSAQEAIDTTTPGGRLVFAVFGALAEFERDLICERTHAGLAAARARGRVGGRKPALTPTKAKAARNLYDAGGTTVAEIAQVVGVSRATLYRNLKVEAGSAPTSIW
jgi:DNA invertase Pin-like site-specific DNA recombinase